MGVSVLTDAPIEGIMETIKTKCEKCGIELRYEVDGKRPLKNICSQCQKPKEKVKDVK